MNNTGVAAKRAGLDTHVIGVEADEGHIAFAREACTANGFTDDEITLHRGVAAASSGTTLFPRQEVAGEQWGLEPIFDATANGRAAALSSGRVDELPIVALADVIGNHPRLDLLHVDIQGGEADLVDASRALLGERVAYLVLGTHSRQIEGRLFASLLGSQWRLEIERPAILALNPMGPSTTVDGVQVWRNLMLLPA